MKAYAADDRQRDGYWCRLGMPRQAAAPTSCGVLKRGVARGKGGRELDAESSSTQEEWQQLGSRSVRDGEGVLGVGIHLHWNFL